MIARLGDAAAVGRTAERAAMAKKAERLLSSLKVEQLSHGQAYRTQLLLDVLCKSAHTDLFLTTFRHIPTANAEG